MDVTALIQLQFSSLKERGNDKDFLEDLCGPEFEVFLNFVLSYTESQRAVIRVNSGFGH